MNCPCGNGIQVKKKSKKWATEFWGCTAFPKCRITYSTDPETIKTTTIKPSTYQQAAIDAFYAGKNVAVQATAGSGKSSMIIHAVKNNPDPGETLVLVFNSAPRYELKDRLTQADVHTFNSFGNAILREHGYKARVKKGKFWVFFRKLIDSKKKTSFEVKLMIERLIIILDELKKNLVLPEQMTRRFFADFVNENRIMITEGQVDDWLEYLRLALQHTLDTPETITYMDQLYLPIIWNLISKKNYKYIYVDEFQDTNPLNMELIAAHAGPTSRLFLVGDPHQSIYMWRDATPQAMNDGIFMFGCIEKPLPETFRNSRAIVDFVNKEFPYIEHIANENAPQGSVETIFNTHKVIDLARPGDMIVAYRNAPLINLAWDFMKNGITNIRIAAKDDSWQIVNLLEQVKDIDNTNLAILTIEEHVETEIKKASETGKSIGYLNKIRDTRDTAIMILNYVGTPKLALNFINKLFSKDVTDKEEMITLYTVHGSKGLESERVFVLEWEKMITQLVAGRPYLPDADDSPTIEAQNVSFVAVTRAIKNLFLVYGG